MEDIDERRIYLERKRWSATTTDAQNLRIVAVVLNVSSDFENLSSFHHHQGSPQKRKSRGAFSKME